MSTRQKIWSWQLVGLLSAAMSCAAATNYYVRPPETCTNTFDQLPFTNWSMAATNIPWVIDLARDGDTITVSNGTYAISTTIENNYVLIIQSSDIAAPLVQYGLSVPGPR